jgi:hypothetical protein
MISKPDAAMAEKARMQAADSLKSGFLPPIWKACSFLVAGA